MMIERLCCVLLVTVGLRGAPRRFPLSRACRRGRVVGLCLVYIGNESLVKHPPAQSLSKRIRSDGKKLIRSMIM